MNANSESIYVGIKGRVIAIDRPTGNLLWETHLKSSGFVNLVIDQGTLIAHTSGELWAIDPTSGRQLWHNQLSGFGYGHVTMASPTMIASSQLQNVLEQIRSEAAASSASTSTGAT